MIAGGRRLEALRELQEEGKLPGDHAVPCQVASDEHALEMSLAENTVRLAMHPADEFEAFARLIDGGESVERIAERFGVTARHVEQRLRLGKAAPELLAAYRAEELTLECLMAFTITDDREKQLQVYEALPEWRKATPRSIREALTEPDGRGGRASWPVSSGWTPTTPPAACRVPTCSASRSISKTPACFTNWPPTSSTASGRSWKPKAGNGWRSAPTAIGTSSRVAAGFTRSRWTCRRSCST